jgi:hypothetical protein
MAEDPRQVLRLEAGAATDRCRDDRPVEVLGLPELRERVRRRSAGFYASVHAHAFTERRVLDGLEQWHRDLDLVLHRTRFGELQRQDQQVRRHQGGVLCPRDPDRRRQDGRIELAVCERNEEAPRPVTPAPSEKKTQPVSDGGKQSGSGKADDDPDDHRSASSRSARSAMTRMSIPGSSRTIRDRREPRRISTRRRSSGVPTKM